MTQHDRFYIIGVDGGASKTQGLLFTETGDTLSSAIEKGSNLTLYSDVAAGRIQHIINNLCILKRITSSINILYLFKLRKMIKKFNFSHVIDLQNSSRTNFYRRYLFNILNWSSSKTILKKGIKKNDFKSQPVLERFKIQLENSDIKSNHCLSWIYIHC